MGRPVLAAIRSTIVVVEHAISNLVMTAGTMSSFPSYCVIIMRATAMLLQGPMHAYV